MSETLESIAGIERLTKTIEIQTAQIEQNAEELDALDSMISSLQTVIQDLNQNLIHQERNLGYLSGMARNLVRDVSLFPSEFQRYIYCFIDLNDTV